MRPFLYALMCDGVSEKRARAVFEELGVGEMLSWEQGGVRGRANSEAMLSPSTKNGFELLKTAHRLQEHPDIEAADCSWFLPIKPALLPNDAGFGLQWGLRNTGNFGGVAGVDINVVTA
jgi:hypothetical protein